jgi:predicted RNase H-like HicB family nuclease
MDRRLRIILELVASGFSSGARGAASIFKGFVGGVVDGAKSAGAALVSLSQAFFFVQNAVNSLFQAGRWLFDMFVRGAGDVEKLEAKLTAVAGSSEDAGRIIDYLRQMAQDTGISFEQLSHGAGLLVVAAKDASGAFDYEKFQRLTGLLTRMQALRPDVPVDRLARGLSTAVQTGNWQSLEMFLDVNLRQLVDIGDAADEVAKTPGKIGGSLIYVETKAGEAGKDALKSLDLLEEALNKAGATAEIVGNVAEKSGLERFQQILADIARIVGKPLFDKLNAELSDLADWLQEHPEEVERFASLVGDTLAGGLEKLFDALENIDFEQLFNDVTKFMQQLSQSDWEGAKTTLEGIAAAFKAIADAIQAIKDAKETLDQLRQIREWTQENPEAVAAATGTTPGMVKAGTTIDELMQRLQAAGGGEVGLAKVAGEEILKLIKIQVEVTSDNDMFDAKVKQVADGAVTDGLNAVAEELESGQ